MRWFLSALAFITAASEARAEGGSFVWLPGDARSLSRSTSASRDTPLFEYAYGPRAQGSLGAELGVFRLRGERAIVTAGGYAMVALANGEQRQVFPPHELWRGLVGVSASVALPSASTALLGEGSLLELTLRAGHESDHGERPGPALRPFDFPEGTAGDFLAPDLALRLSPSKGFEAGWRLGDRWYVRGAIAHAPFADLWLRWRPLPWLWPLLSVSGEQLVPVDPFVLRGFSARALLGLGLPGERAELLPFVAGEAGNDRGLLVHRRELRLSVGVRYVLF